MRLWATGRVGFWLCNMMCLHGRKVLSFDVGKAAISGKPIRGVAYQRKIYSLLRLARLGAILALSEKERQL